MGAMKALHAKQFKEYDKRFAHIRSTIFAEDGEIDHTVVARITCWKFSEYIELWSQADVQQAVYALDTSVEWQKFRVSLKGQSTRLKLYRLERLYAYALYHETDYEESRRIKCRIDNYIGALRRGGFLNDRFEVVKG